MSIASFFTATYCLSGQVIDAVCRALGAEKAGDGPLIERAAALSGLGADKIARAIYEKTSVFNKFSHEREKAVAYLKIALGERLKADPLVLDGFCGLLVGKTISHVMKVAVTADVKFRVRQYLADKGGSEKDALRALHKDDEARILWAEYLTKRDPWNPELHDILLPMDKMGVDEAAAIVVDNLSKIVVAPTSESLAAVDDFILAARVEAALAEKGHTVGVAAKRGVVYVTINKHVLLLAKLEEELKRIAAKVPGVSTVETKVGADFYQADVYRPVNFELPSKVLLVDDEREFVQTLSDRLQMRDMGSTVVFDGEQALEFLRDEEPDVMVLDLKMPGIDGMEVLRRVKREHPSIEVIILTGHGSEKDRLACMDAGAFAYLQKPVDIEKLSDTMRQAYEKVRGRS
ncbi:MAG: response regulator [Desulfovibrionaceae bacterium]|nr:response regulator [Desulfovibrionaceae bacterium]MBF0514454.1 response regulator [Desulfovibrionaceae bacterium]